MKVHSCRPVTLGDAIEYIVQFNCCTYEEKSLNFNSGFCMYHVNIYAAQDYTDPNIEHSYRSGKKIRNFLEF